MNTRSAEQSFVIISFCVRRKGGFRTSLSSGCKWLSQKGGSGDIHEPFAKYLESWFDVEIRVSTDLEVKTRLTLCSVAGDVGCHFIRRHLRDGSIQANLLTKEAAHSVQTGSGVALSNKSQHAMSIPDFTEGCPLLPVVRQLIQQ